MSPPDRPKGEYRSAQREGNSIRPPDRPKGEYRSAQREGNSIRPPDRPKGEYRSAQREGGPTNARVLEAAGLAKAFGGIHAVDGVSFDVAPGELVALIGPNGAGKTTCFNLINGQLGPDAGSVHLCGERIDGLPPRIVAHKGVARTFQVAATFASMSVRENVELALIAHAGRDGDLYTRQRKTWRAGAEGLLARVGVRTLADVHCATLTYGDAKRVELAQALAGAPKLLLMDEPTAGMAIAARGDLMRLAVELAHRDGLAVLFTEHDMDMVFGFADRVIVLDRGAIIASGSPADVRADARVQAVYLGLDDVIQ